MYPIQLLPAQGPKSSGFKTISIKNLPDPGPAGQGPDINILLIQTARKIGSIRFRPARRPNIVRCLLYKKCEFHATFSERSLCRRSRRVCSHCERSHCERFHSERSHCERVHIPNVIILSALILGVLIVAVLLVRVGM